MKKRRPNQKKADTNVKLPDKDVAAVVRYWQRSLVDSQRMEVNGSDVFSRGAETAFADLINERCSEKCLEELKKKQKQQEKQRNKGKRRDASRGEFASDVESNISVAICPLRLQRISEADPLVANTPRFVDAYWIPAEIAKDGTLLVPKRPLPWIPRAYLEPMVSDETVIIGSLDEFEQHLLRFPFSESMTWPQYWKEAKALFKAACGSDFIEFTLPDYRKRKFAAVVLDSSGQGATANPRRIYQQVLQGRRHSGVLSNLVQIKEKDRKYVKRTTYSLAKGAKAHLGQFEHAFPLSPSQRNAVHNYFSLGSGTILAVSGPPGTGKTTLLQSIIASLWAKAAHDGGKPPIILACAETNQAVTNIIESFAQAKTKQGPLAGHWLPGVKSYGTYCPSKARAEDAEAMGIHYERGDGEGLSKQMENWAYIREAQKQYLQRSSTLVGKKLTTKQAIRFFQKEIQRETARLNGDIFATRFESALGWVKTHVGLKTPIDYKSLYIANAKLDLSRRHRIFQLSTHYWEGRWLLAAQEEAARLEETTHSNWLKASAVDWRRRAMVTPCFVSTMSTAARFFGELAEDGSPLIDLLIVDEAGQIAPEVGAASFALAKRAIVVGDTLQLEPIWSIPKHVDEQNLTTFKIVKRGNKKQMKAVRKRGLMASSGNIMQLAQNACPIIDTSADGHSTIGVFLTEHRRSVPEVIDFCNKLAYRGRLHPRRPSAEKRIVPAFGYWHIGGTCEQVGTSKANVMEAEAIASWIRNKKQDLEEFYSGETIDKDIVAIITPFAAQRHQLELLLRKDFPRLAIGTVHSMQGAQRRIMIFSPVYDRSIPDSNYFFDRGVNMLNVAVSRARDSFLTIGDMEIFERSRKAPSGLLAHYLFRDVEGNQLDGIELPPRSGFKEKQITRLSSLAQHRAALVESFRSAQRELIIISPQISRAAIEADSIDTLIRETIARGVEVKVYTDSHLDIDPETGALRENPSIGRAQIVEAGAGLFMVDGIHNKSIFIDEKEMIEGSFNWFSAVRKEHSRYHREETSLHYRGPLAANEIRKTKEVLAFRLERADK